MDKLGSSNLTSETGSDTVALFVVAGDRGHFQFSLPIARRMLSSKKFTRVEFITNEDSVPWVKSAFPSAVVVKGGKEEVGKVEEETNENATVIVRGDLGPFTRGLVDVFTTCVSTGDSDREGQIGGRARWQEEFAAAGNPALTFVTDEVKAKVATRLSDPAVKICICESCWTGSWVIELAHKASKPYVPFCPSYIRIFRKGTGIEPLFPDETSETPGTVVILTESLRGATEVPEGCTAIGPILPPLPAETENGAIDSEKLDISPETLHWLKKSDRPVIYFSLGSHAMARVLKPGDVTNIFNAIREAGCRVLAVMPRNKIPQELSNIAEGEEWIRFEKWVNQQDILLSPYIHAFFSHCGSNSIAESIRGGKPVICLPFFDDQYYLADELVRQGAGIRIRKQPAINAEDVRKAVVDICGIENGHKAEGAKATTFQTSVNRLRKIVLEEDGLAKAMNLIEAKLSR